jgi:hypothetical protein
MNLKGVKKFQGLLLALVLLPFYSAGEAKALPKIDIDQDNDMELYQQVQVWNITTLSNDPNIGTRNNTYIRRGRIGAKGHFYKKMFFIMLLLILITWVRMDSQKHLVPPSLLTIQFLTFWKLILLLKLIQP